MRISDWSSDVCSSDLGYDPRRQRYVGTWVGSMMTHLWVYEGSLDDSGKVLTLDCEGLDFETEGRMTRYQDIITIESPDQARKSVVEGQSLSDRVVPGGRSLINKQTTH